MNIGHYKVHRGRKYNKIIGIYILLTIATLAVNSPGSSSNSSVLLDHISIQQIPACDKFIFPAKHTQVHLSSKTYTHKRERAQRLFLQANSESRQE